MKKCLLIFGMFFLLLNCTSEVHEKTSVKADLTEILSKVSEVHPTLNRKGELILYKSGYCANNDCEQYFQSTTKPTHFYTREDLFMRKLDNRYVEIIDLQVGQSESFIEILIKNGDQSTTKRIQF